MNIKPCRHDLPKTKCPECYAEYLKDYYQRNKERIKKESNRWYHADPARAKIMQQKWRAENPEKSKASMLNWQKNNLEQKLATAKIYRSKNLKRHCFRQSKRKCAQIQRTPKWADLEAIQQFYLNCPKGLTVDHIIPLQGKLVSGLHVRYNLQYLTGIDNISKNNKFDPNTWEEPIYA